MKEMRFTADHGIWRVAFAYDPLWRAIILTAGNKIGDSKTRFYKDLIQKADVRFTRHLEQLRLEEKT